MQRQIDVELQELKAKILQMGELVKKAIGEAVAGLLRREPARFETVVALEGHINQAHLDIDNACLRILATYAPLANNLRYVVAIMKINSDLERMGDQAVNIALNGRYYLNEPEDEVREEISLMASEVITMVNEALEAFLEHEITIATTVMLRDEKVDALKDQIFRDLVPYMERDAKTVQRSLDLILIARNLERIGDHATNIVEDVIFACTGEDVRHTKRKHPLITSPAPAQPIPNQVPTQS